MTRNDVLKLFGGNVAQAAEALGITHQAIYKWPKDEVPESALIKVRYWFLLTKGHIPTKWKSQ